MKTDQLKNKIWILLVLPLAAYFYLGLHHLSDFQTADEHLWIGKGRIAQYWKGIAEKNWRITKINDKPGITLALTSGLGMLLDKDPQEEIEEGNRAFVHFTPEKIQFTNFIFRFPILVFNGLLAFYFFWVIKKMAGEGWTALFASSFILLSPILLGISQIVNPDSLFWSFSAALLFSWLAYLKTEEKKFWFILPVLLGLTLASKYVGIIFFPFLFFALMASFFFRYPEWIEKEANIRKRVIINSIVYLTTIGGGILVFSLAMPAVFVKPGLLRSSTYGSHGMEPIFFACLWGIGIILADALIFKSFLLKNILRFSQIPGRIAEKMLYLALFVFFSFILIRWHFQLDLLKHLDAFSFEVRDKDIFNQLPLYQKFLLESRPLIFSMTPVALFSLLASWLVATFKKNNQRLNFFVLSSFILIFYYAMIEQDLLVHIRYSIILQPFVITLSALGLFELFSLKWLDKVPRIVIFLLILALSAPSLWLIKPFYFNYANEMLPKSYDIASGWGYGGYEAAQYINSLPDAENMKVVADYFGACVFVRGRCSMFTDAIRDKVIKEWANGNINYFIISRKGINRYRLSQELPELLDQEPVWELNIDNRPGNYIRVLKSPASAK